MKVPDQSSMPKTNLSKTALVLGYMGLLPFYICVALQMANKKLFMLSPTVVFLQYSAIILAFLCGTLWMRCIAADGVKMSAGLVLSNVIALAAWGSVLISETSVAISVLVMGYVVLLSSERSLNSSGDNALSAGYAVMRFRLTVTVVLAHILLLMNRW